MQRQNTSSELVAEILAGTALAAVVEVAHDTAKTKNSKLKISNKTSSVVMTDSTP